MDDLKKALAGIGWIILAVAILLGFLIGRASATPSPKYFVCKYVGTPGDDERLQTGQNPISVSGNAITQPVVVGSYFSDQHGRSYVLEEDTGQDEPDVSKCPKPDKPEEPEEPVDIDPHQPGLTPDQPTPMRESDLTPILGK